MRQSIRIDILPVVFVTAIILGCGLRLSSVIALNIAECANANNGQYINNTRSNCNYSVIYCNGANSQFCDEIDLCDPNYNCVEINAFDASDSTTLGTTVSPSVGSTLSTTPGTSTTAGGVTPAEDIRAICRRGITEKYKYPGNCNYYYYCIDGFLIVEQCPLGFVFSTETRACSRLTPDYRGCN